MTRRRRPTPITVTATGGGLTDVLPLSIRIGDTAAGTVKLTTDSPGQRGPSGTTFTFNVTIHNDTAAEIPFTMDAQGPPGWTVAAKPSGQAQATSVTVAPSATGTMTVTATPAVRRRRPATTRSRRASPAAARPPRSTSA